VRRISVIALLTCLSAYPALAADDSPTFHSDYQRTGRGPSAGPVQADQLWSFQTGGSVAASPVVGADGALYVASADGHLYALDSDGGKKWDFEAEESIFATPSLDSSGVIYFGDLAGWFYALGPDGSLRWKRQFSEGTDRRILGSAAVIPSGRSFVASWNNRLYALESDGSIRWQAGLAGLVSSAPALDQAGNVFITCLDPSNQNLLAVYKFTPNSPAPAWVCRTDLGIGRNRITSSPALDLTRNRLYIGACRESAGLLVAVDTGAAQVAFTRTFPKGIMSSPAVAEDGAVLVSCLDGRLYALGPGQGEQQWVFQTQAPYILGSPSLDSLGNVYVGDSEGTVYALTRKGEELWRFATNSNVESSPVAYGRRLYVTSFDGCLYAIGGADSQTRYFPQIGSGVSAAASLETAFRFTNTGEDSALQVEIFDSEAAPALFSWDSGESFSSVTVPLGRGESVDWNTMAAGGQALKVGYARFTAGPGVGAAAILDYTEGGTTMYETGVPSTTGAEDLSLFVDSANHRSMGLAVVNTSSQAADVRFRLYGPDFSLLAEKTAQEAFGQPTIPPGAHFARFASEVFPQLMTEPLDRGLITVESDRPLAAATLCQGGDPVKAFPETVTTLSVFPIIPERPEAPAPLALESVLYFPQVADGGVGDVTVRTSLFFTNVREDAATVVEFFRDNSPAEIDLQGRGLTSRLEFVVKRGEVVRIETAGGSDLATVYARVTTRSGVTATAVYSYSIGGVAVFEATVPASSSLERLTLFVEQKPESVATAVGLVNVGNDAAHIALRVYDRSGALVVAQALAPIPAGFAVRRYLSELLPDNPDWKSQGAVVAVTSDQPLAALSLREAGNPWNFPSEVYRLSSMPVLAGSVEP
jgi:outer membrane protein assembly factor BamB